MVAFVPTFIDRGTLVSALLSESVTTFILGNEGLQEVLLPREKGPATIMVLKLEFRGR